MFTYETTYSSASGYYALPSQTLAEARKDVKRLRDLAKQPGYAVWGIKINKVKETK